MKCYSQVSSASKGAERDVKKNHGDEKQMKMIKCSGTAHKKDGMNERFASFQLKVNVGTNKKKFLSNNNNIVRALNIIMHTDASLDCVLCSAYTRKTLLCSCCEHKDEISLL
jgi:hypothetical protein